GADVGRVAGRTDRHGRRTAVAGRRDHHDAGAPGGHDGLVERIGPIRGLRGRSERQVDHTDVVTQPLIHDPLNAANDIEVRAFAGVVENSHRDDIYTGRDTLIVAGGREAAVADER